MRYLSAVLALFGTLYVSCSHTVHGVNHGNTLITNSNSAIAGKHHNCGCNVRGAYSEELSQATCALWGATQIHTHFDGHSVSLTPLT